MADAGRPTELTTELTTTIRRYVLDGWEYMKIQAELGIPSGTWDHWVFVDFQGFRKDLRSWKQEKMIKKAENVMDKLTDSTEEDIQYKSSSFILETLDKEVYSKRSELTGKNGAPLISKEDAQETVNRLKTAAGLIVSHETQPITDNGIKPIDSTQPVAGDQNVV